MSKENKDKGGFYPEHDKWRAELDAKRASEQAAEDKGDKSKKTESDAPKASKKEKSESKKTAEKKGTKEDKEAEVTLLLRRGNIDEAIEDAVANNTVNIDNRPNIGSDSEILEELPEDFRELAFKKPNELKPNDVVYWNSFFDAIRSCDDEFRSRKIAEKAVSFFEKEVKKGADPRKAQVQAQEKALDSVSTSEKDVKKWEEAQDAYYKLLEHHKLENQKEIKERQDAAAAKVRKESLEKVLDLQAEALVLSKSEEAIRRGEVTDETRSAEELSQEHSKLKVQIAEYKNELGFFGTEEEKAKYQSDIDDIKRERVGGSVSIEGLREKLAPEIKTIELKDKEAEIRGSIKELIEEKKIVIPSFMVGKNRELLESYLVKELASRKIEVIEGQGDEFEKQFALEKILLEVTTFMHERAMHLSREHSSKRMAEVSSWEGRTFGQKVQGFFSGNTPGKMVKMAKRHSGEEYYHQVQTREIFKAMLQTGDAFVRFQFDKKDRLILDKEQDSSAHEANINTIISKNVLVGKEGPAVIDREINELAVRYINGRISAEEFEQQKNELFSSKDFKAKWIHYWKENNIPAEMYGTALNHIVGMQSLDLEMLVSLSRESSSVNTKLNKGFVEDLIIKIQGNKTLRHLINPATIALGGSVAAYAAKSGSGRVAAVLTGGTFMSVAGAFSYFRRSKEVKSDRQMHERQKAFGQTLTNENAPRREKMDEFSTEKISAKENAEALNSLTEEGITSKNYEEVLSKIAEIKSRQSLGTKAGRDFFFYSNEESVSTEKEALHLAVSHATAKSLDYFYDQQRIGNLRLEEGVDVYSYLNGQLSSRMINEQLTVELEEKEASFGRFRRKESAKAATTAVVIGGGVLAASLAIQELFTSAASSALLEKTSAPDFSQELKQIEIPSSKGTMQIPENTDLLFNNGSYDLVNDSGEVLVSGLNVENGQILNPELLENKGFGIDTQIRTETHTVPFEEAVKGERVQDINRDWHDYGTDSPITEGNENKLYINSDGQGSVVDASNMFKDSADFENGELAGLITNENGERRFNNLYALITPTGAEDGSPIAVPIGPDGKLSIDENSPLSSFFDGEEFNGRHLEIAYKNENSTDWDILATVNGEGTPAPKDVTVTTEITETTITPPQETPETNVETDENAPIPVMVSGAPRKPLEEMTKQEREEVAIEEGESKLSFSYAEESEKEINISEESYQKMISVWTELKEGKLDQEKAKKKLKDLSIGKDMDFLFSVLSGEAGKGQLNPDEIDFTLEFDAEGNPVLKVERPFFRAVKPFDEDDNTVEKTDIIGEKSYTFRQIPKEENKTDVADKKDDEEENDKPAADDKDDSGVSGNDTGDRAEETNTSNEQVVVERSLVYEDANGRKIYAPLGGILNINFGNNVQMTGINVGEQTNGAGVSNTTQSQTQAQTPASPAAPSSNPGERKKTAPNIDTSFIEEAIAKGEKTIAAEKGVDALTDVQKVGSNTYWAHILSGAHHNFADQQAKQAEAAFSAGRPIPRLPLKKQQPPNPKPNNPTPPTPPTPPNPAPKGIDFSEVLMETGLETGNPFGSGRNPATIKSINETTITLDKPVTLNISGKNVTASEFDTGTVLETPEFSKIGVVQQYLKDNKGGK